MLEGRGQWEKLDGIKVEIPRETILEAQIVTEYKGEVSRLTERIGYHVIVPILIEATVNPFNFLLLMYNYFANIIQI